MNINPNKILSFFLIICFFNLSLAYARIPHGATVVSGEATFKRAGHHTLDVITDGNTIIDWQNFNLRAGFTIDFIQGSSLSTVLNNILYGPAVIAGDIYSNGGLIFYDPQGIDFTSTARIRAASVIATSLRLSSSDFLSGQYNFEQQGDNVGMVTNEGKILAADNGFILLLGGAVANSGTLISKLGTVALASGSQATVTVSNDQLLSVVVDQATQAQITGVSSAVSNTGKINAAGGTVQLTAQTLSNIFDNAINQSGIINATSVSTKNGHVILNGGQQGTVLDSGNINVSGNEAGQTGGSVEILGQDVGIFDNAQINASGAAGGGEIHLGRDTSDPNDFESVETIIDPDVTLNANATQNGDGGLIETSGDYLIEGSANINAAGAGSGQAGTWLLDPYSVTISGGPSTYNGSFNGGSPTNTFAPSATGSAVGAPLIENILNGTNGQTQENVDITTGASGAESGNITFQSGANISWDSSNSLTLDAYGSIVLGASIVNAGTGSVNLIAEHGSITDDSGVGYIQASTTSLTAGSSSADTGSYIDLGNSNNSFGTLTATAYGVDGSNNGITLVDGNTSGLTLGNIITSGNLNVTAAGNIYQVENDTVDMTSGTAGANTASFNIASSDSGVVSLENDNDFNQNPVSVGGAGTVGEVDINDVDATQFVVGSISAANSSNVTISADNTITLNGNITGDQLAFYSNDAGVTQNSSTTLTSHYTTSASSGDYGIGMYTTGDGSPGPIDLSGNIYTYGSDIYLDTLHGGVTGTGIIDTTTHSSGGDTPGILYLYTNGDAVSLTGNNKLGHVQGIGYLGAIDITDIGTLGLVLGDGGAASQSDAIEGNDHFNITATSEAVTQTAPIVVEGATDIDAGTHTITLTNTSNDFGNEAVSLTGGNISLEDSDSSGLVLGNIVTNGNLTFTATDGISQSGSDTIDMTSGTATDNTASFNIGSGGSGDIILGNDNDFNQNTVNIGGAGTLGNVTLTDVDATGLNPASITAGGDINITASAVLSIGDLESTESSGEINLTAGSTSAMYLGGGVIVGGGSNSIDVSLSAGSIEQFDTSLINTDGGSLSLSGGGSGGISLLTGYLSANMLGTLTGSGLDGSVSVVDNGSSLTIGNMAFTGSASTVSLESVGTVTQTGNMTVTSGHTLSTVTLEAGSTLIQDSTASINSGGGTVLLRSTGSGHSIEQEGAIETNGGSVTLEVNGASTITQDGISSGEGSINTATTGPSPTYGTVIAENTYTGSSSASDSWTVNLDGNTTNGLGNDFQTLEVASYLNNTTYRGDTASLTVVDSNNLAFGLYNLHDLPTSAHPDTFSSITINSTGYVSQLTSGTGLESLVTSSGSTTNITAGGINSGDSNLGIDLSTSTDQLYDVDFTASDSGAGVSIASTKALDISGTTDNGALTATSTAASTLAVNGDISTGSGNISLTSGAGINESSNTISSSGTLTLQAGSSSSILLTDIGNDLGTVSVTQGGELELNDTGNLTLGNMTTSSSNIQIQTASGNGGAGNITFNGTISDDSYLQLDAAGSISQTAGSITATSVKVESGGATSLNYGTSNSLGTVTTTIGGLSGGVDGLTLTGSGVTLGAIIDSGDISVTESGTITQATGAIIDMTSGTAGANTAGFNIASGGTGSIDLGNNNDFNQDPVSVGGAGTVGNVTLNDVDTAGIVLGNITTPENLSVTAANDITQSTGSVVAGTTDLTATGSIDLENVNNSFGYITASAGSSLTLVDGNADGVELDGLTSHGTLSFTSVGLMTLIEDVNTNGGSLTLDSSNNINQSAGTITATGASITATGTITLTNTSNDFGDTAVALSGGTIQLTDSDTTGLILGNVTASGNLTVTAANGITQAGSDTIDMTSGTAGANTASFDISSGNSGDIILDNANDFNQDPVSFAGAGTVENVSFSDIDATGVTLGASTINGNLDLTVFSPLTQSGALTVSGTSDINAESNDITLTNTSNDFGDQTVTLTGDAIQFTDSDPAGLNLGAVFANSTVSITAKSIIVNDDINAGTHAVNLTATDTGITTGNNAIYLSGGTLTAGDLNLTTASGAIYEDLGLINSSGTITIAASDGNSDGGNVVDITNPVNQLGTVNITNAGNVTLYGENGYTISGISSTGDIYAETNYAIDGSTTTTGVLEVSGAVSTTKSGGTIILSNTRTTAEYGVQVDDTGSLSAPGDITIDTTESETGLNHNGINILGSISNTSGNIYLYDNRDFGLGGGGTLYDANMNIDASISTDTGSVTLEDYGAGTITIADAGSLDGGSANTLTVQSDNGSIVQDGTATTEGSTITMSAYGDFTQNGTITAGSGSDWGNINLTADGEAEGSTGTFTQDGTVEGNDLTLIASSVNGEGPLLQNGSLISHDTSSGNIGIGLYNSIGVAITQSETGTMSTQGSSVFVAINRVISGESITQAGSINTDGGDAEFSLAGTGTITQNNTGSIAANQVELFLPNNESVDLDGTNNTFNALAVDNTSGTVPTTPISTALDATDQGNLAFGLFYNDPSHPPSSPDSLSSLTLNTTGNISQLTSDDDGDTPETTTVTGPTSFTAGGFVGTLATPFNINASGTLSLTLSGENNGDSGVFTGSAASIQVVSPPPGDIIFNGTVIYPLSASIDQKLFGNLLEFWDQEMNQNDRSSNAWMNLQPDLLLPIPGAPSLLLNLLNPGPFQNLINQDEFEIDSAFQ